MSNKALQKDLERGLPDPLYCFWSEESFFLEEALSKAVKTVIAGSPEEFNLDIFYPSSAPQEILDALITLPLMAQRRLVVIKDYHQFSKPAVNALTPYFAKPYETVCLLILSQKKPKFPSDFRWKIYPLSIREAELSAWLKMVSKEKGVQMTDDAIASLVEFSGHDIGSLLMEVEKLKLMDGKIGSKEVASSISNMREYTAFDLTDAITAGQNTKAFRILKAVLSGNASQPTIILGALNWHYKQFYLLWRNKGKKPIKMRENTYTALRKHLTSLNEENFCYIFQCLHEADLGIKSSGRPEIAMEALLIKLLKQGRAY
ncbi:MAG: DNA polymerase III subunit delta [Nitrospirae bacterium]|nr:DNA polymerase III subunit delta [Nitrospirota bacterium]